MGYKTNLAKSAIVIIALTALTTLAFGFNWKPSAVLEQTTDGAAITLKYQELPVSSIKYLIDGKEFIIQDINGKKQRGENFIPLDNRQFAAGNHYIAARLYDAEGRLLATAGGKFIVKPDPYAPVSITRPLYGSEVSGTFIVDVRVANSAKKPYVSFFIDNKFVSLRNFPPYQYAWDTTQETNGWHEITSMVYDDNDKTYYSQPVRVFVNNMTGRTERETTENSTDEPPIKVDVSAIDNPKESLSGLNAPTAGSEPLKRSPASKQNVMMAKAEMPKTVQLKTSANLPAPVAPQRVDIKLTTSTTKTPVNASMVNKSVKVNTKLTGQKLAVPQVNAVKPSAPATKTQVNTVKPPAAAIKTQASKVSNTSKVNAKVKSAEPTKPALSVESKVPVAYKVQTASKKSKQAAVATPKLVAPKLIEIHYGARISGKITSIWNNNVELKFDVAPKVVNGLALAPIRPILESIGAEIDWNNIEKTIKVNRNEKEITIVIGLSETTIDGKTINLESAPFIVSGRTILPLSFWKDAFSANVAFDPTTGKVTIVIN